MLSQSLWNKVHLTLNLVIIAKIEEQIPVDIGGISLLIMLIAQIIIAAQISNIVDGVEWSGKIIGYNMLKVFRGILSFLTVRIMIRQVIYILRCRV
jgi:hypothetical protein